MIDWSKAGEKINSIKWLYTKSILLFVIISFLIVPVSYGGTYNQDDDKSEIIFEGKIWDGIPATL